VSLIGPMPGLADEYRAWERFCREQAARADTELARKGLLWVADDCRDAAEVQPCFPSASPALIVGSRIAASYWRNFTKFLIDTLPTTIGRHTIAKSKSLWRYGLIDVGNR
jgi:hypothetical protein